MSKIKIHGHLAHPDYPWSVGKLRVVKTLPATDAAMAIAEATAIKARRRRDADAGKRLMITWTLAP